MHSLNEPTRYIGLHAIPLPVYIVDADGFVTFWNEAAAKTFGYDEDSVLGKFLPIVSDEQLGEFAALRARVLAGETLTNVGVIRRRNDGEWIKLRAHAVPIRDEVADSPRVLVLAEEISVPTGLEVALRQSEERFQKAFAACPDVMLLTRKSDGCILAFNESAEGFFGAGAAEVLGNTTLAARIWVNPADRAKFIERLERDGRVIESEFPFYNGAQAERICVVSAETVMIDGELCIITVARDVTSQREAERGRQESEARYQAIMDNSPGVIFLKDLEGRYLTLNRTFERELNVRSDEVLGKTDFDLFPANLAENFRRDDQRVLSTGTAIQCDDAVVTPSGVRSFLTVKFPLLDAAGKIYGLCGIATDVSERRKAEAALSESNAMLGVISRAQTQFIADADLPATFHTLLKDLLALTRSDAGFVGELVGIAGQGSPLRQLAAQKLEWNDGSQQFVSSEAASSERQSLNAAVLRCLSKTDHGSRNGLPVNQLVLPFYLRNEMLGLIVLSGRTEGYTVDDRRFIETVLNTCASLVEAQRANERRRLAEEHQRRYESQLRQANKMEAIGTLAGGVAHDFNNILTGIFNGIELARMDLPESHSARQLLDDAMLAGQRAKNLVNQILTFSHRHELQRVPLRLGSVVQEAVAFLRATMPASIQLRCSVHDSAATIMADPTQLHQVVMNLGTNAAHAMRERGGVLECRTEIVDSIPDAGVAVAPQRSGRFVQLTVADTGTGMDAPTVERIFEPFYTTKSVGEGTGLGLAVVHGIMENHEGRITVESQLGKGTTFRLFFPAVEIEPGECRCAIGEFARGRGERILWIDDETMVTTTGAAMLSHLGYQVVTINNSMEALAAIEAQPDSFDLAVLDLNMPRLTGDKLAAAIRQIRPDARLILMSGYSGAANIDQVHQLGFCAQLAKPFTYEDLAKVVRQALDETRLVW